MNGGQAAIDNLKAQVTKATTIMDGAIAFINGVPGLIAAAVEASLANGATAEQLAPLTDLGTALGNESDALQTAMTANTTTPAPAPQAHKKH